MALLISPIRFIKYLFIEWKPTRKGWKSRKDVTLYDDRVNWIFSCGSKITKCTHSFLFWGGGNDKVCLGVDIYDWCNVAHAKRTFHTIDIYPSNISDIMVNDIPKNKIKFN